MFCWKGNEDEAGIGQTVSCFVRLKQNGIRTFIIRIFYYKNFCNDINLFNFSSSVYVCVEVDLKWGSNFL